MDLKKTGINTRNWVKQTQDRYQSPFECGIERLGVSYDDDNDYDDLYDNDFDDDDDYNL